MPKYSERSLDRLESCHPDLIKLFREVIRYYDCTIIEGHRSSDRQDELFRQGQSKLVGGESKHNHLPSLAVDVIAYPIDWKDTTRAYNFGGYVKGVADLMGIKIRWGGDWDGDNDFKDQTFNDLVHFELIN